MEKQFNLPVKLEIEAIQFTGDNAKEVQEWVEDQNNTYTVAHHEGEGESFLLIELENDPCEQTQVCEVGEWVIAYEAPFTDGCIMPIAVITDEHMKRISK